MEFGTRSVEFQKEMDILQKKYEVELYATQVVLQSGDIVTLIKIRDTKTYDNSTKTGNTPDKKV